MPASAAPSSVRAAGRRSARAVAAAASIHAAGPAIQPQLSKNSCESVRPVASAEHRDAERLHEARAQRELAVDGHAPILARTRRRAARTLYDPRRAGG